MKLTRPSSAKNSNNFNRISTYSEMFYTVMQYHSHINSQGVSVYTRLEILKRILFCLHNMEKPANSYVLNSVSLDKKKWHLQK